MEIKRRILDIDDDQDVLDSRRIVLEHNGFEVSQATNTKVAAEILEREPIDLIILDVMMEKDSDGFNFAHAIKRNLKFSRIPIIMVSAVNQKSAFVFDKDEDPHYLPVEKFMEKPIDPDDLVIAIKGLLH